MKIIQWIRSERVRRIFQIAWVLAVLGAAIYYFSQNINHIVLVLSQIPIHRIICSILLIIISKAILAISTQGSVQVLEYMNTFSYLECLSINSISQLGKYLPGGIWHFVSKFGFYRDRGLNSTDSGKAIFLENLWLVTSAFGSGMIFIYFGDQHKSISFAYGILDSHWILSPWFISIIGLLGIVSIMASPVFLKGKHNRMQMFKVIVSLWISWFLFGLSYAMLIDIDHIVRILFLAGVFAISWSIGYLAVFAPGGVGVREFVLVILLSSFSPYAATAVAYASFHRVLWLLSEIILGIAFSGERLFSSKYQRIE